jgi:hypothetical protein
VALFGLAMGHSAFARAEIFSASGSLDFRESLPQKSVGHAPKKNPDADYARGFKCVASLGFWGRAAGVGDGGRPVGPIREPKNAKGGAMFVGAATRRR